MKPTSKNLILEGKNAWYGGGNAGDNVIIGNEFDQQIDGKGGNDFLIGGGRCRYLHRHRRQRQRRHRRLHRRH
ncbi:hypothetical protein ACFSTD_15240 [Novosphingobium colocasiae]